MSLKASRFPPTTEPPVGLAQHLFQKRQGDRLTQSEAAAAIGVDLKTYKAWEVEGHPPHSHNWPSIIAFLGCDPILATPTTFAELVSAVRRRRGFTAKELGAVLGVYKLTVRAWEAGRRQGRQEFHDHLRNLLVV